MDMIQNECFVYGHTQIIAKTADTNPIQGVESSAKFDPLSVVATSFEVSRPQFPAHLQYPQQYSDHYDLLGSACPQVSCGRKEFHFSKFWLHDCVSHLNIQLGYLFQPQ